MAVVDPGLQRLWGAGSSTMRAVQDLRGPWYLYAILMGPRTRQGT
jgi:hypothetical protein